jgi:hypothetical protein
LKPCSTGLVGLCLFALVAPAGSGVAAQSLGEVARKEQERRKTIKSPSKVYTNEDLAQPKPVAAPADGKPAGSAPLDPVAVAKAAPAPTPPSVQAPAAPPAGAVKDQAYWRERMSEARTSLERSQMFRDALQSRINSLTTDFVNRDDPAQRAAIAFERQRALAELDRVTTDIQKQTELIASLEDEARRAGVPPGWLR